MKNKMKTQAEVEHVKYSKGKEMKGFKCEIAYISTAGVKPTTVNYDRQV